MGRVMVLSRMGRDRDALGVLQEAQRASGGALVFTHGLAGLMASSPDARVRNGRASMDLVQQMLQRGRARWNWVRRTRWRWPNWAGPVRRRRCRAT